MDKIYNFTIVINNFQSKEVIFVLEPWADEYKMGVDETFIIQVQGPIPTREQPRVDYFDEAIVFHSWAGTVATVSTNGELLSVSAEECIPVPIPLGWIEDSSQL